MNLNNKNGFTSLELKSKLIQIVKNKGIFDNIKSNLRNKLIIDLDSNLDQKYKDENLIKSNLKSILI